MSRGGFTSRQIYMYDLERFNQLEGVLETEFVDSWKFL